MFISLKTHTNKDNKLIGSTYDSFNILKEKIEVSQIFGVSTLSNDLNKNKLIIDSMKSCFSTCDFKDSAKLILINTNQII